MVSVRRPTPETASYVEVELTQMVQAAGLARAQAVLRSAGTSAALLRSLDSHAEWIRVVHPLVIGEVRLNASAGTEMWKLRLHSATGVAGAPLSRHWPIGRAMDRSKATDECLGDLSGAVCVDIDD